jgi:hypothetical protein
MNTVINVIIGCFLLGFGTKVCDKVIDKVLDAIFDRIKSNQKFVNFCNDVKTKSRNVWQLHKNVVVSGVIIMSILLAVAGWQYVQLKQQEKIKANTTVTQSVTPTKNTQKEDKQLEYINAILQNPTLIKIIDTNDLIVKEKAKINQAVINRKITVKEAEILLKELDSNITRPEEIELMQKTKIPLVNKY